MTALGGGEKEEERKRERACSDAGRQLTGTHFYLPYKDIALFVKGDSSQSDLSSPLS